MNVDIVDEESTSYSIDGGVQRNKTRKYCHFHFLSLKSSIHQGFSLFMILTIKDKNMWLFFEKEN